MNKWIKKILGMTCMLSLAAGMAGCGGSETTNSEGAENTTNANVAVSEESSGTSSETTMKAIENLRVYFVPSREPEEIISTTEPLKELLKSGLKEEGYDVNNIDIQVGTSYEAVGEALSAGTADIGFIPGGTYVLYDDGADVILTATREGLNKDSDEAKDWNDGQPTTTSGQQATSYRALIIAGPSEKGQELAEKINKGEALSFDDLNSANWSIMSSSSPAGYIYPSLWLKNNYGKSISDLSHAVQSDSYGSAMARLASGQVDVLLTYADARRDYEEKWTAEYGRSASIWEETNVIGVTPAIYNDTISVSKTSEIMDDAFKTALQNAFIKIGESEEGKAVIAIYSHEGYQVAKASDYDNEREAQKLVRENN